MNNYKMKIKTMLLLGVFGGVFSSTIDMLIGEKHQFMAILAVVLIDMIFGIIRAVKQGNFQTKKSFKGLFRLVAFWWLLATVLVLEQAYSFAGFLSEAILLPILVFQLISVLKNMSLLGIISNELLLKILKNIDAHKHEEPAQEYTEDVNPLSHE